jgi:hypothetical protein
LQPKKIIIILSLFNLKADIATLYRQSVGMYKDMDASQLKLVKSKWPKLKSEPVEKFIAELEKERMNKEAWRKSFVPPYFESVWGKYFLETGLEAEKEKMKSRKADEQALEGKSGFIQGSFDGRLGSSG